MKLKKLLDGLEIASVTGRTDCEIRDVVTDSNAVTRGSLFVCINGGERDGHDYVRQAERYGAAAVVTEKNLETGLTQIIVKNTRKAVSELKGEIGSLSVELAGKVIDREINPEDHKRLVDDFIDGLGDGNDDESR